MLLSKLLNGIIELPSLLDVEVSSLTQDSRHVQPGALFFALAGSHDDGQRYISDAIQRGAVAIIAEGDEPSIEIKAGVLLMRVPQLRAQLGLIAATFFQHPAKKLSVIGVTGTNGKTSCSHYLAQALTYLQTPCGVIGTLGNGCYPNLHFTGLTTPNAVQLQCTLNDFVLQAMQVVAMEVSSHSIAQGRIVGTEFAAGIFTNLTQDHLDYHGDMQTYAAVKQSFLTQAATTLAIVNIDDDYGRQFFQALKTQQKKVLAYGIREKSSDIYAANVQLHAAGCEADILTPWGQGKIDSQLIGEFNLYNLLAVVAALGVLGYAIDAICAAVNQLQAVAGRMQALGGHDGLPLVIVDYAHTPDALEKVLSTLKQQVTGKLYCIFGCGGDRDKTKRPLMGEIAARFADEIVISNDNPRHEEAQSIANDIVAGIKGQDYVIKLDRATAIRETILLAGSNDCVLIAGKGAEHYQQIGETKFPFDDVQEAQKSLQAKGHCNLTSS